MSAGILRCIAHGDGEWQPNNRTSVPYQLSPNFMPKWESSSWWWGCEGACCRKGCATCLHKPGSIRPELKYDWRPTGPGCQAMPQASMEQLRAAWCEKFAGRKIVFVGDSIQGQFFSSFAHQVGYVSSAVNASSQCCKMMFGGGSHECDLTAKLCSHGPQGVRVRYIRNAYLYLSPETNAAGRHLGNPNCDWIDEAQPLRIGGADRIVLSSGMHVRAGVETIGGRLKDTLRQLAALMPSGDLRDGLASRLIYRSVHAPMYNCSTLRDPMSPDQADALQARIHAPAASEAHLDRYNWSKFAIMEDIAKTALAPWSVPYLDVYRATSMRPGGYNLLRPRGSRHAVIDCGHYCLPGPLDEWTRLLLVAMLNHGP